PGARPAGNETACSALLKLPPVAYRPPGVAEPDIPHRAGATHNACADRTAGAKRRLAKLSGNLAFGPGVGDHTSSLLAGGQAYDVGPLGNSRNACAVELRGVAPQAIFDDQWGVALRVADRVHLIVGDLQLEF